MIGVIVCTHANLASGLNDAIEMIAGKQENFDVVGFYEGEDMLSLSERLQSIAKGYEEKHQRYVCVVDLYGATPFNASAAGFANFDTSIITGVNLPLLLELVTRRQNVENYEVFLAEVLESAKGNMQVVKMKEMFE